MSEQAAKIFEALSNVDEELLERCNREEGRNTGTIYRLYRHYGKAMAACLCLVVAGVAAWGGYRLTKGSYGADSSAYNGAAAQSSQAASSMAADCAAGMGDGGALPEENQMEQEVGTAADTTEGKSPWEYGAGEYQEPDSMPEAGTAAAPSMETAQQESLQDRDSAANLWAGITENKESAASASWEEIPWEEACVLQPFAGYLPTYIPQGYEPYSAGRSSVSGQSENICFWWSDGERILSLNMTQGGIVTGEDIARRDGLHEYLAEEFDREQLSGLAIMEQSADQQTMLFTLYYADGMKIDFEGNMTVDEMWETVESIAP